MDRRFAWLLVPLGALLAAWWVWRTPESPPSARLVAPPPAGDERVRPRVHAVSPAPTAAARPAPSAPADVLASAVDAQAHHVACALDLPSPAQGKLYALAPDAPADATIDPGQPLPPGASATLAVASDGSARFAAPVAAGRGVLALDGWPAVPVAWSGADGGASGACVSTLAMPPTAHVYGVIRDASGGVGARGRISGCGASGSPGADGRFDVWVDASKPCRLVVVREGPEGTFTSAPVDVPVRADGDVAVDLDLPGPPPPPSEPQAAP